MTPLIPQLELSPSVKNSRYISWNHKPKDNTVFFFGYEECLPNFSINRKSFPFWVVEYILEGRGEIMISRKRYPLQAGSIVCYGPGVPIQIEGDPHHSVRKYFSCRSGSQFPDNWAHVGLTPGSVRQLSVAVPFAEVLDQLLYHSETPLAPKAQILTALELVILSYAADHNLNDRKKSQGATDAYRMALEVIQKEFRQIRSLGELAARTGYGEEYLCRVFRRHHNESPYQALLRQKMNEAFRLLREGQQSVASVALRVGFEDAFHFSRVFRKTMGFPPSSVS